MKGFCVVNRIINNKAIERHLLELNLQVEDDI